MTLKSHGRYDFSPITERPVYDWPNGTRLAIHFSLNVECFSFGEGVGNDLAGPAPQPNIRSFAWRDWGNRVGVWRMLDALEDFELPCALLLNTETYDYAPQIPASGRVATRWWRTAAPMPSARTPCPTMRRRRASPRRPPPLRSTRARRRKAGSRRTSARPTTRRTC